MSQGPGIKGEEEVGILLLDVDGTDIQDDKLGDKSRWAALSNRMAGLRFSSGLGLADRIHVIAQSTNRWPSYVLTGRLLVNTVIIFFNFFHYRRTMPDGWWLDASGEKLLYHLEFIILNLYLGSSILHLVQGVRLRDSKAQRAAGCDDSHDCVHPPSNHALIASSHLCYASDAIHSAAGFWFGVACPRMAYVYRVRDVVGATWHDQKTSKSRKVLLTTCCIGCIVVYSWFGFLAVLVYIRRYPFIVHSAVTDWTYWQMLCFAALLNNVGSITDESRVRRDAFLDTLFSGEDGQLQSIEAEEADSFLAAIMHYLCQSQGLADGFLHFASLTEAELQKVAVQDTTPQPFDVSNSRSTLSYIRRTWLPPVVFVVAQQLHARVNSIMDRVQVLFS